MNNDIYIDTLYELDEKIGNPLTKTDFKNLVWVRSELFGLDDSNILGNSFKYREYPNDPQFDLEMFCVPFCVDDDKDVELDSNNTVTISISINYEHFLNYDVPFSLSECLLDDIEKFKSIVETEWERWKDFKKS